MQRKFFTYFAYSIFLVFVINGLGSFFSWYNLLPWYDNMVHFLGGVTLGWFFLALFYGQTMRSVQDRKILLLMLSGIAFIFVVAFMWEVFEFGLQGFLKIKTLANPVDSGYDLIAGLLGGLASLLIGIKIIISRHE